VLIGIDGRADIDLFEDANASRSLSVAMLKSKTKRCC